MRYYGLLAGATRKARLDEAGELLGIEPPVPADAPAATPVWGRHMVVSEAFERWCGPHAPPHSAVPTGTITP